MPIYEYLCNKCGHEFEREQRISEDPIKTCPACRGRRVKRLISQTSFVLKGGGWHSDLYSSAKASKKDGATASSPAESSDTSSASKSESGDESGAKKKDKGKPGKKSAA